jgi:peptidase C25-like protein/PKD domain-containing protein
MNYKYFILPLFVVLIMIISSFGAVAIAKDTRMHEEITLAFNNLSITQEDKEIILDLQGSNSNLIKNNHYIIPTYQQTYTFPKGTTIHEVSCSPRQVYEQEIPGELTIPPKPFCTGFIEQESTQIKEIKPIAMNTWFDYHSGCGINNNEQTIFLKIQVYPIQYYPSDNKILCAEQVDICIDYTLPTQQETVYADEYDLIILTPTKYMSTLDPLVEHKNTRGISTKLVTLDDIEYEIYFPTSGRDTAEQVKYFIKNAIEQWNTRFVLLVGGAEDFPMRATHVFVDYNEGDAEVFASDLYFADIYHANGDFCSWDSNENDVFGEYNWSDNQLFDDVDLYPDVYLGRLACVDEEEVTTCVNKIKTYETNEAYKQEWFTNIVVIGGDTSPNDEEDVLEGEYVNQAVLYIMNGFVPTKCWASEGSLGSRGYIDNAINNGCGFVDFSGHGNPYLWGTHPFNQPNIWIPVGDYKNKHISELTNENMLPIVVTGACSVAKFPIADDSFCWSIMSNPNGGGIASFGPSALSWGYDTSYCIEALGGRMQVELFKAYKQHGAITAGEMWVKAISNYIYPEMDSGDHKTIEEWEPFIDPTLAIADESQPPNKPVLAGPSSGKIGDELTYEASTSDIEEDMVYYLFDWGDGDFSNWIGPVESGQKVNASHVWSNEGDFQIRVQAKDDHGVQSAWSDPLSVTMPKNKLLPYDTFLIRYIEHYPFLYSFMKAMGML